MNRGCIVEVTQEVLAKLLSREIETPGVMMVGHKEVFERNTFLVKYCGDRLPDIREGQCYPTGTMREETVDGKTVVIVEVPDS